ncbi:MAG: MerR family transcriptional regulator [Candidatus Eisenbacteria bacterium]|nr:MerR family transcriptional regulator [Candidatus Eisenbacteria bacterium]
MEEQENFDPALENGATGNGKLSIGALSRATGIPIDTLRTWERRYGFPVPERKNSGHRVYSVEHVDRLRRIATALQLGVRAREAVSATDGELDALVKALPPEMRGVARRTSARASASLSDNDACVAAVARFDSFEIQHLLHATWVRLGPVGFCAEFVGPVLTALGEGWEAGTYEIRHEHFFSEQVADFLRVARLPFEDRARGPLILFCTLPADAHGFGLQMAALIGATSGCRILIAGTGVPVTEIASTAREISAAAVALSVSSFSGGEVTSRELTSLRQLLPKRVELIIGGAGARTVAGARLMGDLREFDLYCQGLSRTAH